MNATTTAAHDGNSDRSGDWKHCLSLVLCLLIIPLLATMIILCSQLVVEVVAFILLLCCALVGVYWLLCC